MTFGRQKIGILTLAWVFLEVAKLYETFFNKGCEHVVGGPVRNTNFIRDLPRRHFGVLRDQTHDLQTDLRLLFFAPTSQNDALELLPHQASHYAQAQVLGHNDVGQ